MSLHHIPISITCSKIVSSFVARNHNISLPPILMQEVAALFPKVGFRSAGGNGTSHVIFVAGKHDITVHYSIVTGWC